MFLLLCKTCKHLPPLLIKAPVEWLSGLNISGWEGWGMELPLKLTFTGIFSFGTKFSTATCCKFAKIVRTYSKFIWHTINLIHYYVTNAISIMVEREMEKRWDIWFEGICRSFCVGIMSFQPYYGLNMLVFSISGQ